MKNLKRGAIVIALFLALFLWWSPSKAENLIEVGPSQVGSTLSTGFMLTMTERIKDRYDFTLGYISEQTFETCDSPTYCNWLVKEQIFVGVELLATSPWTDKLRLGIGPYMFQRADRIGTDTFRIGLSIEYRFNERFGVRARHFSTAGSGGELTICRDRGTPVEVPATHPNALCQTNDWNTGQDSWLRAVIYFK